MQAPRRQGGKKAILFSDITAFTALMKVFETKHHLVFPARTSVWNKVTRLLWSLWQLLWQTFPNHLSRSHILVSLKSTIFSSVEIIWKCKLSLTKKKSGKDGWFGEKSNNHRILYFWAIHDLLDGCFDGCFLPPPPPNPIITKGVSPSRLITGFILEDNFLIGRKERVSLYKNNGLGAWENLVLLLALI